MDSTPTDTFQNAKSSRPHKNNARLLSLFLFTFLAGHLTLCAGIPQTIVFPETGPLLTTDAPITLQASATSGLAVSYRIMSPGGVAVIDGNTLTLSGLPGSVTIKASQAGDGTYDRAPDRYQSFVVGDASQRFVQIASGRYHIVGIRADGTLWAWGYNVFGQLGDGTETSTSTPVQIGSETSWSFVACGGMHTLALRSDGSLWGWGNNYAGQLGDGTTTRIRNSPVQIGRDTNWASVACGDNHTVAVRSDGSLWAWGSNEDGKLGDGGTNRSSPTRIGSDTNWTMAACGLRHTVAIRKNGSLWAWGDNKDGQLGNGTTTGTPIPAQIGNDTNWKSVTCDGFYTMAVRTDSTLWAWGYNAGRLGDGTGTSRHRPVQIGSDTNWSFLANSTGHTMGVRSDGTLWAWGDNYDGQLGHGGAADKSSPIQVRSERAWTTVACGDQSTVALAADGTVWSWGSNYFGQLGRSIPVQIGSETGWTSTTLTVGTSHAMLLRSDGTLWSWGYNTSGQLGDGTMIDRSLPVQIGSESNWAYVACGGSHTAALRDDGSLWAWGNNSEGQLGNGAIIREGFAGPMLTNYPVSTPLHIASERTWASVACGSAHTVAVSTDGSLWAWGSNDWNRLGDGTTEDRSSPVQIGNATNWSKVACGERHTVAVRTDGSLWAWGHNGEGQLGDGTLIERNTPIQIGSSTSWASVSCGSNHTVAMSLDGSLWAWGSNYFGQLGVDTSGDPSSTPNLIGSSETWTWKPPNTGGFHHPIKTIACGADHTLAMGSDGTLWAWGNTTSWRNAPAQFGNVRTWTSVGGGRDFTAAIRSDGTFWGATNHGQLGPRHLLAPTLAWPPRGEHTFSFSGPDEVAQDATLTLSATLSSGLPVTYTVVGPATLEGTTLIPTAPGRLLVTAYPKRDDAWTRIEPISRTIEVTHTSLTAREAFNTFITANSSLTGPDAEPTAIPFADGLPNLLRYAFHTDFSAVGVKGYEPSRASGGFPIVTTTQDTVRIKFVRRKGSGLVYTPMKSTSLSGGEWLPLSTSPIIGDLDEFFELVIHEEPRLDLQCFVRVEVSLP